MASVGSMQSLPNVSYQSKVSAPKNPKLIRELKKIKKLTPSEFLKEMSMDTKQKLANTNEMYLPKIIELLDMGETSLQKNTQLEVDEPMFQPFPSDIYFQKFEPFNVYEVPLLLRNNDKVPRLVKVTQVDTPYFKIITSSDAHQKVGPGLPVIYKIQFFPEENKDYNHELIVSTEREKFIIPIKCIGSRAILDFPDEINFSLNQACAVKHLNTKVLLIRNIGNKDAKFSLKVEKPFSVSPDHGILPIGENMQVTVDFQPMKCGEFKKDLMINYDSSESVYVNLYGTSQDFNVRLDKNSLRIEDTYITMNNQRTVTIHNRSNIIMHYEWKKFATIEEEEQQKLREMANLNRDEENAKNKLSNQSPDYVALLSRNFQNKMRNSQNKKFHFEDNVFFIQPIEGDIWPNSSVEVNVIFRPDFAQTYNKIAYCEVTGRESRLPLRLSGVGNGPKVQLSIESLDVGNIFIGSIHVYEVILANKGFIDAIYSVALPNTKFGKFFSFEPNEGLISPNSFQAVSISFGSNKLGDFNEVFEFTIDGKPEKCKLNISGSVIPPTFTFDIDKIRFNQVSYGFKYGQTCSLKNTSLVPMAFNLRVASDSETREHSMLSDSIHNINPNDTYNFKEFSIKPSAGIILPQSDIKIAIEFVPHFIKKYETSLIVDIEDVGTELLLLPITARSTVPSITLLTNDIDMGRCFIYHTYEKYIKLSNDTPLKARYYILPSKNSDPFKFTSNQAEGVIEPNSTKDISVFVEALQLDDIEGDLLIKINGSVEPLIRCRFICLSQGPVVQITPKNIEWGLTTVLVDSVREISVTNESLIEAKFNACPLKRNSPWRIEPSSGVVPPCSEIKIKAICYLIDKAKYEDIINIDIEHSHAQQIAVKSTGAGCSIVSEPPIGNCIDFGTFFSGGMVKRVIKLTNKSSKPQNLSFCNEGRMISTMNKKEMAKLKNYHPPPLIFTVTPSRVELVPGASKEITIEGSSEKPQLVEETQICTSIVGKMSGKDKIMKFKIKCEFIAPVVSFSTRNLVFRCEHDGNSFPENQYKTLTISNISSLDVTAHMKLNNPFYLIEEDTGNMVSELLLNFKTGQSLHVKIMFSTLFKKDTHNETINSLLTICYAEHQHNDQIDLTGEIFFPNIYLETSKIDFGCILNNTEVSQEIKMTNIGPLAVHYKWKFILEKDNIISNRVPEKSPESRMSDSSGDVEQVLDKVPNQHRITSVSNFDNGDNQLMSNITADPPAETTLISEHLDQIENEILETRKVESAEIDQPCLEDVENLVQPRPEQIELKSNRLAELLNTSAHLELPSIEEIFDISPLYGCLHPGEAQKLKVTYYGHKEIKAYVKAICEVTNGPDYELLLKGEASVLSYELNTHELDLDYIPFDEVSEGFIKIRNLGKVAIDYSMIGLDSRVDSVDFIEPDRPIIVPPRGSIEANAENTIVIKYLPGMPKKFSKKLLIQISHFAPEEIIINGESGFADIMLDLPRLENDMYLSLFKEAQGIVQAKEDAKDPNLTGLYQGISTSPELDLQVELDRLAIQKFVKSKDDTNSSATIKASVSNTSQKLATQSAVSINDIVVHHPAHKPLSVQIKDDENISLNHSMNLNNNQTNFLSRQNSKFTDSSKSFLKKKQKPVLPDYLLDFGHVILGTVKTHVIRAANMGKILASFEIERQNFSKTGFLIDLEKVRNLPNEESVEFVITFDPRGANLGLGPCEHVIPLNITNGPIVNIRLKANVTMPDLQISNDLIEFGDVKCGECKIITVQIHNHKEVRCDWNASYLPKKDEKFVPMHLKRKKKADGEGNRPRTFEIMPPNGTLMPGQKVNIQLKFMPHEEKPHEERVTIRMSQSSQRIMILCKGKGLEPRIEFSKNSLEFEPILPHSTGDEQEVKLINPCPFPIEVYNLEFDKNYLDEEKVLRVVRGYDEFNTILLPPRGPGDKLPNELIDYYDDLTRKLEEEEKKQKQMNESLNQIEATESARNQSAGTHKSSKTNKTKSEDMNQPQKPGTAKSVGDVEKNPVFDSIAQYLGIDLSSEGRAARNRRGVSIIINGPPLSGKSKTAVALAKHYDAALLTIDSIITDAITNSQSPAAFKVRQICAETAAKVAEEARSYELNKNNSTLEKSGNLSTQPPQPGLSEAALAQHAQTQGTLTTGKRASVAGESNTTGQKAINKKGKPDISLIDQASTNPTTPPPLLGPVARKLSICSNQFSQEFGYMSTVLPEDVIVDLLSERFQLSDCNRGIVIDGLDTLFAQNYLLAATAVLKAFNNRRYIYCITMKSDFQKYKEQLNKIQEEILKKKIEQDKLDKILLEEMDEETYNNLPYEKRKEIDDRLLETKKLRLKREAEEKAAAEKERLEREQAEQVKQEEEKKKKKGGKPATAQQGKEAEKKGAPGTNTTKDSIKPPAIKENEKAKDKPAAAQDKAVPPQGAAAPADGRPITKLDQGQDDSEKRTRLLKNGSKEFHEDELKQVENKHSPEEEKKREAEKLLQQRFKTFDLHFKDIINLLDAWDRTQGNIFRQPSPSEKSEHEDAAAATNKNKQSKVKGGPKDKDKKEKEKAESEKPKTEAVPDTSETTEKEELDVQNQSTNNMADDKRVESKEETTGIPHIIIEIDDKLDHEEICKHPKLPPIEEVLDGMGMGSRGPPIPPPATFSVVSYPVHRKAPPGAEFSHYIFVTNDPNDPNLVPDEKPKEAVVLDETINDGEKSPDNILQAKSQNSNKQKTPKTGMSRNESRGDNGGRRTSGDKKRAESKSKRDSVGQSPNRNSSSLSGQDGTLNQDGIGSLDAMSSDKPSQKLQRFRWIIPQYGQLVLKLRFTSEEIGQFDQTLNYEILGTKRRYQLHCRGICTFPKIVRDPRIVFPGKKKSKEANEIIHKKYLLTEDLFDFGPLLVGNNKERVKEGKFPEYSENLTIQNGSPLDSEVSFCFLDETTEKSEACFYLDPPELVLKPHETKTLRIFATPKEPKFYEDTLVCCIKENPEPILFKIQCHGQKPELTLDKKEFNFKQVLLHRKDSKEIKMSNNTMLPVQWKIEGIDTLGDEFICNQTTGIIDPYGSFNLILHFRALKPLLITPKERKILKVLVSSLNGFLGFMENHLIQVTAEAYDVALEINLPKGNDGGLDFGSVRVSAENKLACTLKNKGKYPIKFNFLTESQSPETMEVLKYLTISPVSGELPSAHDRNSQNQTVTVCLVPLREINIKDAPVLKCQITEPAINEGVVIANIPIKLTVKAVVSEFNIIPQSEIYFGPMNVNSKRQEKLIIENKGEMDFKFTIAKHVNDISKNLLKDNAQNQGRLQIGIFTITPAFAIILPNGHQVITIECAPEHAGKFEEDLCFDITDRNMQQYPNGIMYKLTAEATHPIITNSIDIFEEHTIIPNITALDPRMMGIGIYAEDENKFLFNNVIVGRTAKARFKLANTNKIPIDISILLKASSKSTKTYTDTTFEVEPQRVQIGPYSSAYTTISFSPSAMQNYNSYFEATLENMPPTAKHRAIAFEVSGDGNLPRFNILKPSLRNKKGQCLMLFKRTVIHKTDSQQLVLGNDGTLPTKVNFYLYDPDQAFKFKPILDKGSENGIVYNMNSDTVSSVIIQPNTQISFNLICTPTAIQTYQASLQLNVTDNQFEDTLIQIVGEGYMEDVIFDNLHSLVGTYEPEEDVIADEEVMAVKCNSISFGDVYINDKKQLLFTMKNQSKSDCYRFEWPAIASPIVGMASNTASGVIQASESNLSDNTAISFMPRIGHLHAGCAKDITVSFKSADTKIMRKELFQCQLSKVTFEQPINEVKDWDDRMTMVKWVNEYAQSGNHGQSSINELTQSMITTSKHQLGDQSINLPGSVLQGNTSQATQISTKQIIRRKVIEVEPEPRHNKSDEACQPMELYVSANCDFSKYKCRVNSVRFKDTLMFQTRVYEVAISNRGKVKFDYNWRVIMEDSRRPFTPFIQADSPSPDSSPSPVRGRKSGKHTANGDNSVSPGRKKNADAKKDAKKDGKSSQASKAKENESESTPTKGKQASKNTKSNSKPTAELIESTLKMSPSEDAGANLLPDDLTLRPDSASHLRAESSLSHHAPSMMTELGYVPFSVEPAFGKIEPGQTSTFKIKFSPLNLNDYQARVLCQIPNTEDGKVGPMIAVKGRGLLPYCHVELEESDYIISGRRDPDLPGPGGAASGLGLDPMTKVMEFECIGLGTKILKKFEIINPTSMDYHFEWLKDEYSENLQLDQFVCHKPQGILHSGKKSEITFEFVSDKIGIIEDFWKFRIPQFDLTIPFLLVGNVTEPKVIFDRSHVSFKPLLIGKKSRETVCLINQESKPLEFAFDQASCYTEGRSSVVIAEPSSGVLQPDSKLEIVLTFQPREQRMYVFNLKCKISNSSKPLNLNIKSEGFSMLSALYCEDSNTGNNIEFSDTMINEIHMGEVEKNETCIRNLYIYNTGKHTINFEWFLSSQFEESLSCFSIEPQTDLVGPGDKMHCVLKYTAKHERSTIANLILKVENGSVYHIHLDGIAVRPDLSFSFNEYDFGHSFIYKAGMVLKSAELNMINHGNKDLNVSCLSDNSSYFQFDFKQMILLPGKSHQTTITFIPRECKKYNENIVFELNGLTKRVVNLRGIGTQLKLELVDAKQKLFDIGTLQIGQSIKKDLKIINRSIAPIDFNLLFEPRSEYKFSKNELIIGPLKGIHLKPNQVMDLLVKFAPKARIPQFTGDLSIDYNGLNLPLCAVKGACHGYNIWLDFNTISFGAISQKCSATKRLIMHNDGDIGASFKWEQGKMRPEFSIYPVHGYISPGMEVNFDIKFNPSELDPDLRKENIMCHIEGIKPLAITLSGSCIQVVPQKEIHSFDTYVRQKEVKQISISNRTNSQWDLKPLIEGEFFSGLDSFIVEAQSNMMYEVTYFPMTMCGGDGKKHSGSIFFPLPDGTGLLYNLSGNANPPKPVGKINREVPCKMSFTETLPVENWLKKPQRFKVSFEILKPEKPDPSTTIKGNDYIDVPGNGRKDYKLHYYSHKEGATLLRIVFKNEVSGEYSFYEIGFKSVKGGSVGTIDLVTQVRVPISYSLKLDNPLTNMVTFNAVCTNNTEILFPTSLSIIGKGQGDFNFEFLPLKAGEINSKLELTSADLGICTYDLNLKAIPAAAERPIHFKTSLGNSQTLTGKILNFCRQKTDYICKIDNPDFKIDKSIAAAPSQAPSGIEVSFEITFEPSCLDDTRANLVLSSSIGGDYIIPLTGTCAPPKPQGPFLVKATTNTNITFKNVFSSTLTFSFAIDNPLFHVSKPTESIKAHQIHKIVVGFDGNDSPNKADVMAKLVVTAPKSAGVTNNVQWIYYLKGTS